ncbi:MAG TPA: hypothetical protein VHE78_04035 [Gemmatimonadaceae bacterium]|nr:hypothetical protein [Gemmatimonadaceae bacterium]
MDWKQRSVINVGRNVQTFLDARARVVGNIANGRMRQMLDAAVTGMTDSAALQEAMSVERSSRNKEKNKLRRQLITEHLRPIVAIAQKKPTRMPSIARMRMPHKRTSDERLLIRAGAMVRMAAKFPSVFTAQQIPLNYVEHCRGKMAEMREELSRRDRCVMRHVQATGDLAQYASKVRSVVYILNTLVVKRLRTAHPALLEAWKGVKRYPQKPGPKRPRTGASAKKGNRKRTRRRSSKAKANQS